MIEPHRSGSEECPACRHTVVWVEAQEVGWIGEFVEAHWACSGKPVCPCECFDWCADLGPEEEEGDEEAGFD